VRCVYTALHAGCCVLQRGAWTVVESMCVLCSVLTLYMWAAAVARCRVERCILLLHAVNERSPVVALR
jgi:hypothetical protein